jgi:hypothetical protein
MEGGGVGFIRSVEVANKIGRVGKGRERCIGRRGSNRTSDDQEGIVKVVLRREWG